MESGFFLKMVAIVFSLSVFYGNAAESPKYILVHAESDYEIRLYREVTWMSALVQGTSFQNSTRDGFHRIYQYIHGSNLNSSQLEMTAPVLTSIAPPSSSGSGTSYYIRLFLSKGNPPLPNPELNLQLEKWKAKCIAVRKFTGFADDDNAKNEMEALVATLTQNSRTVIDDTNPYTIAQYNSSRHLSGRLNEVWIDVSGFNIDGCVPHQRKF